MVGVSEAFNDLRQTINLIAPADTTVLIEGESGVGKELVAEAIHELSSRAAAPFVAIDCCTLHENLFESELFGHERGAFTGADRRKDGLIEVAENGTVFLRGGTFRRGFVGEHLIATVNAVATDSGVADIEITEYLLVAGDGTGNVVDVDQDNITDSTVFIADESGSFEEAELSGRIAITINTDVDSDGEVDLVDVSRFMAAWFDRDIIYDFNSDGTMSFADFSIILADSFRR